MTMAEFFEPNREAPDDFAFRQGDFLDLTSGLYHGDETTRVTMRQVGDARRYGLQILHERYEPGADTGESMLEHAAQEGGIVTRGAIELTVDGQVTLLSAGDGYLFDSRRPHRFRNIGDEPAELISACTPPYL
jgi:mannose-6-phosphate isomerase-like protein (cupin superfamily)